MKRWRRRCCHGRMGGRLAMATYWIDGIVVEPQLRQRCDGERRVGGREGEHEGNQTVGFCFCGSLQRHSAMATALVISRTSRVWGRSHLSRLCGRETCCLPPWLLCIMHRLLSPKAVAWKCPLIFIPLQIKVICMGAHLSQFDEPLLWDKRPIYGGKKSIL